MATTRPAIESAIQTVFTNTTGVQHVIIGYRNYQNPAAYRSAFIESGGSNLQVWFIRRVATPQDSAETSPGQVPIRHNLLRHYSFRIEGFFSAQDDGTAEASFQTILDNIITAFDNQRTLTAWMAFPINLITVDEETLGSTLCHHAVFTIDVDDMISGLSPA